MIRIYANWRIYAVLLLAVPAVVLVMAEHEQVNASVLSKIAGMAMAYAAYRLFRNWHRRGLLSETDYITECDE